VTLVGVRVGRGTGDTSPNPGDHVWSPATLSSV
jgi:hypothetical protein